MLQADHAVHPAACVASQPQGVPHAGYPEVLHAVEYPDPLPLMLDASIDCEQPAQFQLTLVVQYHVLHASVSDVVQTFPEGQVLVLVLVPPEQALQSDHAPHSLATHTQGV